jgi:glycosyltransferase involved in cell wall biosynthesis
MLITVGICTWNRSNLLRATLQHLEAIDVPAGTDWELLVVDNNSTDTTWDLLTSFRERLPLRQIREPTPGKSFALNRASREARGEYILWTDDDVLVDRGWMRAYVDAFRRRRDAVFFGGPIEPCCEGTPPGWLRQNWRQVAHAYASLDLGPGEVLFDEHHTPYGANMAVRAIEQRAHAYDHSLGPRPGSGLRGEEHAWVLAALRRGGIGYWVPAARVLHWIPRERQTISYLRRFYEGQGEYLARVGAFAGDASLFGRPRWLFRELVKEEIQYSLAKLVRRPEEWLRHLSRASIARGALRVRATPESRALHPDGQQRLSHRKARPLAVAEAEERTRHGTGAP